MKKKDVKRLFKQHPQFKEWLVQDETRAIEVRKNPSAAAEMFKKWNERSLNKMNFHAISEKTKRASEMLSNVQSVMNMFSEYMRREG